MHATRQDQAYAARMPYKLSHEDRLRLMKFVCSFAWADLQVQEEERQFVGKLVRALDLPPEEQRQVSRWLEVPPRAEEVDPQDIPLEHRELFLEAARQLCARDGVLDAREAENFSLLKQLLQ